MSSNASINNISRRTQPNSNYRISLNSYISISTNAGYNTDRVACGSKLQVTTYFMLYLISGVPSVLTLTCINISYLMRTLTLVLEHFGIFISHSCAKFVLAFQLPTLLQPSRRVLKDVSQFHLLVKNCGIYTYFLTKKNLP